MGELSGPEQKSSPPAHPGILRTPPALPDTVGAGRLATGGTGPGGSGRKPRRQSVARVANGDFATDCRQHYCRNDSDFRLALLEVSDSLMLAREEKYFPITRAIFGLLMRPDDGDMIASALGVFAIGLLGFCLVAASVVLGRKMGELFRA